jgi:hypothetical protein
VIDRDKQLAHSDPRTQAVAAGLAMGFPDEAKYYVEEATAALTAADAHDVANNVHQVRLDDATVERVAQTILEEVEPEREWGTTKEDLRELYRGVARAVLAAAVEVKD